MNKRLDYINENKVERYAVKFLLSNCRHTLINNETLEKTFRGCCIPAQRFYYEKIKARINEMKNDPKYKFYDE